MRVTLQVAMVYTPLVLLFRNNQGKVAPLYTTVVVVPQKARENCRTSNVAPAVVDFCEAPSWYSEWSVQLVGHQPR